MTKWLFAIIVLIAQEVVLFSALLVKTYQGLYNIWIIHTLFILATSFDIVVGYYVGKWVHRKWPNGKFVAYGNRVSRRILRVVGKRGKPIAYLFLGTFSFPFVSAFIATWLPLSFWEMFFYMLVGNIISYAIGWFAILGIVSISPNATWQLPLALVFAIVAIIFSKIKFSKVKQVY